MSVFTKYITSQDKRIKQQGKEASRGSDHTLVSSRRNPLKRPLGPRQSAGDLSDKEGPKGSIFLRLSQEERTDNHGKVVSSNHSLQA